MMTRSMLKIFQNNFPDNCPGNRRNHPPAGIRSGAPLYAASGSRRARRTIFRCLASGAAGLLLMMFFPGAAFPATASSGKAPRGTGGFSFSDDAGGFVLLSETVPDAILDIRYYSSCNFVGRRIDGYEEPVALLTREAAAALREVSDELVKKGYRLKIFDAYRPQSAVDHFMRWARDSGDAVMKPYFYPNLDKGVLFKKGFIAARSGHTRGSAVDLTLFDMAAGRDADMGGGFDWFGPESHQEFRGLTAKQRANRKLLRDAMTAHGFRAISNEWWHFSLKNEPYPRTLFTFPVSSRAVSGQKEAGNAGEGAEAGAIR